MTTPTFRQQYDKIVGAYMRNELRPMNSCACFIGNMLNGKDAWNMKRFIPELADQCLLNESNNLYTWHEVKELEKNFLDMLYPNARRPSETTLFAAMESTLQMLRQLHESKGEAVEDYSFERRVLI